MIVACKLSTGLMLGSIPLRGSAYEGRIQPQFIYGDYGLTYGVPKEAWEDWFKAYGKTPFVTNHIIFAAETEKQVKDWITGHVGASKYGGGLHRGPTV